MYFVHEIRAVYDGKLVSSRESDMIRRSERETTEVNLKEENSATEVSPTCFYKIASIKAIKELRIW